MEVVNTYKKTTIGYLPEDWSVNKLKQISTKIYAGATPSTRVKDYWNGNIPWMSSGEINKKYVYSTEKFITNKGFENSSTNIIPINSILIALAGQGKTRGTVAVNKIELTTNQSLAAIVPNEKQNYKYIYYFLDHNYKKIRNLSTGAGGRGGLNLKIIGNMKIPTPPLPEQNKIANILSTWDEAIELKQQLIDLKKEQKKGLMQKLLTGEVRLPGFSSKWEEKNLKDISNITMGQSPKSKSYNSASEGLPLIQGNADIKNRKTNPSNWTTQVTKECNVGDIILTVRAPVGTVAKSIHNACIGRGVCAIKAKNCQMFLYQVLLLLEKKWVNLSQGSTFESINSTEIRNFKISIPTPKEQEAIARVLSRADSYIELLENEVEILKEQKQGLMQQLLTGQTRVKV